MRRIGIIISLVALLLAALALPGSASASHLSRAGSKAVSKHCKVLRTEMGAKAFKRAFGKGKRHRKAHRRCVSRRGHSPRVSIQSLTLIPSTAAECPPGTQPEPPLPVSAFAVSPACVALPPASPPPPPGGDEDEDDGDDEGGGDNDGDDDDDDNAGDDDGDDEDEDD